MDNQEKQRAFVAKAMESAVSVDPEKIAGEIEAEVLRDPPDQTLYEELHLATASALRALGLEGKRLPNDFSYAQVRQSEAVKKACRGVLLPGEVATRIVVYVTDAVARELYRLFTGEDVDQDLAGPSSKADVALDVLSSLILIVERELGLPR